MKKAEQKLTKGRLCALCEVAMMQGNVMPITRKDNLEECVDYILKVITNGEPTESAKEILAELDSVKEFHGFCVNTLSIGGERMNMITFLTETEEDNGKYNVTDPHGAFCYVYNVTAPFCSEWGYSTFESRPDGTIHRIA